MSVALTLMTQLSLEVTSFLLDLMSLQPNTGRAWLCFLLASKASLCRQAAQTLFSQMAVNQAVSPIGAPIREAQTILLLTPSAARSLMAARQRCFWAVGL